MSWLAFDNDRSGLVFVAGFFLGSTAWLIFRFATDCAHHLGQWGVQDDKTFNVDTAEKGGLKMRMTISLDEDLFSLEKRAFFNQSWLFACHRSRFAKAGDYLAFTIGGTPVFIVLGKDLKLRAFHNVCRHRAYTVVRRAQGSSLRFSCKYHGWQYDSQGKLVKAPQFEDTGGFNMQKNGLYEILLHVDVEGFVFVNFATSAADPPVPTSSSERYGGLTHWECFEIKLSFNWRFAVQHLVKSDEKESKGILDVVWRLMSLERDNNDRPLSPLARLQQVDGDTCCTLSVLPQSSSDTTVRFDIYSPGKPRPNILHHFKSQMHKHLAGLELKYAEAVQSKRTFICQGSMLDDVDELLSIHLQQEQEAGKSIDPASKHHAEPGEPGTDMLCQALKQPEGVLPSCPKQQALSPQLEW